MTSKQQRVLQEYCEAHNLRPELSIPSIGQFNFTDASGRAVIVSYQTMAAEVEELRQVKRSEAKRVKRFSN